MGIEVAAPSRLHFGLLSFGPAATLRYGGCGLMLREPGVRVRVRAAERWSVGGRYPQRVAHFADRFARYFRLDTPLRCRVEVVSAPPEHQGLGLGTALGLSVGWALARHHGVELDSLAELAASVGRGQRSAVGVHGFALGGFVIERGKPGDEGLSPLECRLAPPDSWRVVLLRSDGPPGLSGRDETRAFHRAPTPPGRTTESLRRILREELAPAIASGDCQAFGEAVYRYGRIAGECFARVQGGPYNGSRVASIVANARRLGARGVGQSSWGPSVFAILESPEAAADFDQRWRREYRELAEAEVCRCDQGGARIRAISDAQRTEAEVDKESELRGQSPVTTPARPLGD